VVGLVLLQLHRKLRQEREILVAFSIQIHNKKELMDMDQSLDTDRKGRGIGRLELTDFRLSTTINIEVFYTRRVQTV
jgi:hypothetical protein